MIEHTTLCNKQVINSSSQISTFVSYLNAILSDYEWKNGSEVITGSNLGTSYGKYYFTVNSYIKIYSSSDNSCARIDIVTPNGSKTVFSGSYVYWTLSYGKTSNGVCLCVYSDESDNTRNPRFYNLYVGDITTLDGQTTKGCIYVADDNSYVVATDSGISSEATFASTIDSTKKAYLIPVTDSTTGAVFKDVYMMACAPVQYTKMKVADNKYLCGKAFCLADE